MTTKKFDPTKPVMARGRPARVICTDSKAFPDRPLVVEVEIEPGKFNLWHRASEGRYYADRTDTGLDVTNVAKKTSKFCPLFGDGSMYTPNWCSKPTLEEAWAQATSSVTTTGVAEFQYEDGVLVDIVFHKEP